MYFSSLFLGKDPTKWYPKDGGWVLHVVSTVSEWMLSACFCLFILSFVNEFRKISLEPPRVSNLKIIFYNGVSCI